MSRTKKLVKISARVSVATLLLSVNFTSPSAVAQDSRSETPSVSYVLSQVLSDLDQIKETAFAQPFVDETDDNSCSSNSKVCQCQHCGPDAKVCKHLALPKTSMKVFAELPASELWADAESTTPLACSMDVRSTDIIPPVPNIEDYATPDEFVDDDMINQLQSNKVTLNKGIENYCEQMSKLLSDTLSSDNLSSSQKTAAINSAMTLAVVNAQIAAEAKIAQIKASHESELAVLRGRLLQYLSLIHI